MPPRSLKPCLGNSCPELVRPPQTLCEDCRKKKWKVAAKYSREKDSEDQKFYNSRPWKEKSIAQRKREPFCRDCAKVGKKIFGTLADHILPIKMGGERLSFSNLQTLCDKCHNKKRQREQQMYLAMGSGMITVVCGPPGAGKSEFVKVNKKPGDIIVDFDYLYHAISFEPLHIKPLNLMKYALAIRDELLRQIETRLDTPAWIIASAPRIDQREELRKRFLQPRVVVIEADLLTCEQRVSDRGGSAERKEESRNLVREWWTEYQRDDRDEKYNEVRQRI